MVQVGFLVDIFIYGSGIPTMDFFQETTGEAEPAVRGKRALTNFEAGKLDLMSRFSIPSKLYGREKEVAIISSSFERVVRGETEVIHNPLSSFSKKSQKRSVSIIEVDKLFSS